MSLERKEEIILNQLIHNDSYHRKVAPHIKEEYFHDYTENFLYKIISDYSTKYHNPPSIEAVSIAISEAPGLNEQAFKDLKEYAKEVLGVAYEHANEDTWLFDTTEEWCSDQAVHNSLRAAINIIEGRDKHRTKSAIPEIMQDALAVSFDTSIGHDYTEDSGERWEILHRVAEKIPFDVEMLNVITNGGLEKKTLNCVLAHTGVGKTIFLGHMAANVIAQGKNVLYVTMEMAEEKIAQRIDANLMRTNLSMFPAMSKAEYTSKFDRVKRKGLGRLVIKEFPTATAHAGHIRNLIQELALKKKFVPDFICVDYLNIMCSQRASMSGGSYFYIKSIAEELRGLAVECNVPVFTATQTNRGGYDNSDLGLEDTSESFGLPSTLDLYLALMAPEKLVEKNRVLFKQLKNRYRDENENKKFVVGLSKPMMRFYDVADSNYDPDAMIDDKDDDDTPAFDKASGGRFLDKNFAGMKI